MPGFCYLKDTAMNMKEYYEYMLANQTANPIKSQTPQPEGINTLWIPVWSGNRTATLNLNHRVNNFDETTNTISGEHGNCMTPYIVIEVPLWFTEEHVDMVADSLCKEMKKPANYPTIRVLKAVRIVAIQRIITTLLPQLLKYY